MADTSVGGTHENESVTTPVSEPSSVEDREIIHGTSQSQRGGVTVNSVGLEENTGDGTPVVNINISIDDDALLRELAQFAVQLMIRQSDPEQSSSTPIEPPDFLLRQVLGAEQMMTSANKLQEQFDDTLNINNLDAAIIFYREGMKGLPHGPECGCHIESLKKLANALLTRFQQGGQKCDLDEAISLHRHALELLSSAHPDRSSSLNNLASALLIRFEHGGQTPGDIDEAISVSREALELQLSPDQDRSLSLNNLANSLTLRYEKSGQKTDLEQGISAFEEALENLPSSHSNRPAFLVNYAIALSTRFRQDGQKGDLDKAISMYRESLGLLPSTHPYRSTCLNNLAIALSNRFDKFSEKEDLDEAISMHRQGLAHLPPSHPIRSPALNNLASALNTRFQRDGHQEDFEEAMSLLSTAAQSRSQSPTLCFLFCKHWITLATKQHHFSLITAYETALRILPQVAALTLTVDLRHQALISRADGLARDASQCAIRTGDLSKAIELLEGGRSIFWAQVISLRSPFDRLRDVAPECSSMADRLQVIAQELEMGSQRDISAHILDNHTRLSVDEESSRLNRLNEEWEEIILKVRELPGLEDFLLPPRLSTLRTAASKHPIVLLVANDDESHCLIMTSTNIHHITLPDFSKSALHTLVLLVNTAVSDLPISRSLVESMRGTFTQNRGISFEDDDDISSDDVFKLVLQFVWDKLITPVIGLLGIKKSSDLSFIQWCPTGHFTFLPIHAAGLYNSDNSTIECASDYFISSYTPTLGVLLSGPSLLPSQKFKMMTVIQSHDLSSTKLEMQNIRKYVPDNALTVMGVSESPAYVETVASSLSDVSIAHFACHGYQDPSNPLDSWLKLDDGQLRISRIMKEKMPNGALAFLSACETAMGDAQLPDEAMSLAASLIFCGFRRVVATMWMMRDQDGPIVANAFYRELFRGPDGEKTPFPDVTKSAYALHVAVNELRSKRVSFRRWVPFIHMGQC